MDLGNLVTFALALAVAAAIPGPGVAALVARMIGNGAGDAAPMIAGLALGDLVYLALAAFGLAAIAQSMGVVFLAIKWIGAAYLLYMAWTLWTAPAMTVAFPPAVARAPAKTFLVGLSVTLGNPKVMVFYLAILPALVDLTALTALGFAEMALVATLVLAVVLGAYAGLAARARQLLRSERASRLLNRGAGAVMAGAALSLATR